MRISIGYADSVARLPGGSDPSWVAGLDLLKSERQGAHPQTPFFVPAVYGGCHGGVFGRAAPRSGKVNPVAPATLLIDLNGGGSQSSEDLIMSKKSRTGHVADAAPCRVDDLIRAARHFPNTPEDLLVLPPGPLDAFPINALNCALSRASAVLLLLSANGGDLETGFSIHHDAVMDALWCLDGLLAQAKTLANASYQEPRT